MEGGYDPNLWQHSSPEPAAAQAVSQPETDKQDYSHLYSVPRRFDLASMLVMTAGYALLFTIMRLLDAPFGMFVYFGCLLAFVAIAQSVFEGRYSPRQVSFWAGVVFQGLAFVLGLLLVVIFPNHEIAFIGSFDDMLCFMVFVLVFSPFIGYLSGALVAGTFLVADSLRGTLSFLNLSPEADSQDAERSSPWDD